jgi:uncharacterized protein with PQ loop repeat
MAKAAKIFAHNLFVFFQYTSRREITVVKRNTTKKISLRFGWYVFITVRIWFFENITIFALVGQFNPLTFGSICARMTLLKPE